MHSSDSYTMNQEAFTIFALNKYKPEYTSYQFSEDSTSIVTKRTAKNTMLDHHSCTLANSDKTFHSKPYIFNMDLNLLGTFKKKIRKHIQERSIEHLPVQSNNTWFLFNRK